MSNHFDGTVYRLARTVYVVLMKDDAGNPTLLVDPGLDRPWSSKNKRLADFHAKQCNGEARTWQEAFDILKKHTPNLEDALIKRMRTNNLRQPNQ